MNNNNSSSNNNDNHAAAPIPVGFRFHPTDEELVGYYLHGKVGRAQRDQLIQELDLYKIEPWDLHELCRIGEDAAEQSSDWYFFSHKDKKYPTGNRANRATAAGFWKATGRDKPIHTPRRHVMGLRKTLVFYLGRAPHGQKTDWIMHEFRLIEQAELGNTGINNNTGPAVANYESDGWVVCRVFRKMKNFKSKSPEETSCSLDEDLPHPQPNLNPNSQLLSSSESRNFPTRELTSTLRDYHGHFNFTCKQEISVDDYGVLHPTTVPATPELQHSVVPAGQHPSPLQLRSSLQQACRPKMLQLQDHHELGLVFHGDFASLRENFDDARFQCTTAASPLVHTAEDHWMQQRREQLQTRVQMRDQAPDQMLADVTCHIHVKRHENLVHLWHA